MGQSEMYYDWCSSHDLLLVVLELEDDGLDVLALALPLLDALLGVRVEVLLLLILQGLVVQSLVLVVDEVLLGLDVLFFSLLLEVVCDLNSSLSFFFSFLLLSDGQLFVSELPELGKLHFFSLCVGNFLVPSIDLILPTLFDGGFHFSSSHFFFFK